MTKPQLEDTVLNANDLVSSVLERWRAGEQPNTAEVLDSHPELRAERSLVVDLAYVEYCLRKKAGEDVKPDDFSDRFPSYRQAIRRSIEVHDFMGENPEISDELSDGLAEPAWPALGDELSGFRIAELLGRGALARVYLAREEAVGNRLVVVKVSQDGASEAQLLGKLSHENIMEIYSVQRDALTGMTVICTPLVGTATLVELLNVAFANDAIPASSDVIARVARQHQPAGTPAADLAVDARPVYASYVEAIAHMGWQLARALEAAHRAGITHRDIKPSNVLLSWSGKPLLLDFNLSTDPEQPLKRLGGTHAYMPPERLRAILAKRAELDQRTDPRADVFSWGVLLYQLLTGKLPFSPANVPTDEEEQLQAWLDCRLAPALSPRRLNPQIDPELAAIIAKCIEPEASARFATAQELAQKLEHYLSPRSRALRLARRNRRGVLAAGGAVLASAVAGGVYIATRPDYSTRQYMAGLDHYDEKDFTEAIAAFDRALQQNPASIPPLFARGQALRQLKDFTSARRDFSALMKLSPHLEFYRCLGICDIELGSFPLAILQYEHAIADGFRSSDIYNNLAYCYFRSSPARASGICDASSQALLLAPDLHSARWLRCEGTLRLMASRSARIRELTLPEYATGDIESLLSIGRPDHQMHEMAASIYEIAGRTDAAARERAKDHLRKFFEMGKARGELKRPHDPVLVAEAFAESFSRTRASPGESFSLYVNPSFSPRLS